MSEHPRDRHHLTPDAQAEAALLDALDRGRLHHAWLLCGPEGVGKATFAYRAARRLLGAAPGCGGGLSARETDPVSQLISAQSHPDLLVLERLVENGKVKKSISVDQARGLSEFFSKSPSVAQYRVAIVDAADDLNTNAANALLKVLEEPPERGVLFLITHAPGRLLPTIRSRCRRLTFSPWPLERLAELVAERAALGPIEAQRIAAMAGGSPGAALNLASPQTLELDALARRWVHDGANDIGQEIATAATFRAADGPDRFDRLMDRLAAAIHHRALSANTRDAAAWSTVWSVVLDLPEQVASVNLDRSDALAVALSEIRRVHARTARPSEGQGA
jgi:DNA polymerase-3 subunit delta'